MGPFRGPYRGSPLRDPCWWAVTTEVAAHWEEVLMGPFRGGTHRRRQLLYLGSSSLSSIDCLYESATCKEQAGGPAVVCRSASPMAKSVLVSENPFVFRVFEVRTFFAEEVPLYILHIRGLSFRLLWEEDHVDCRRGISSLLFRKGNPHFKEGFC